MQNVPPPPAETVSKGMAHSASNLGGNKASGSTDPYAMSAQERSKYESLFPTYDSDRDGFVTGPEAVNLFSQSRLPREVGLSLDTFLMKLSISGSVDPTSVELMCEDDFVMFTLSACMRPDIPCFEVERYSLSM